MAISDFWRACGGGVFSRELKSMNSSSMDPIICCTCMHSHTIHFFILSHQVSAEQYSLSLRQNLLYIIRFGQSCRGDLCWRDEGY